MKINQLIDDITQDITTDPRDLYFNLEDQDFQYYQASRMKGSPLWWRVVDCFNGVEINVFEIAQQQAQDNGRAFKLARHEVSIKQATHWLYAALMWSRYTAQTDQRLENDVSLLTNIWML